MTIFYGKSPNTSLRRRFEAEKGCSGALTRFVSPTDARPRMNRSQRGDREDPPALWDLLAFTALLGAAVRNVKVLAKQVKVGNVLTISTPRYHAYRNLSHVVLLCAAPGSSSRGQS